MHRNFADSFQVTADLREPVRQRDKQTRFGARMRTVLRIHDIDVPVDQFGLRIIVKRPAIVEQQEILDPQA